MKGAIWNDENNNADAKGGGKGKREEEGGLGERRECDAQDGKNKNG